MISPPRWQGGSLARLFDDQSGCIILRHQRSKVILRALSLEDGEADLFVKIYRYPDVRLRVMALLGRNGAQRELDHCRRLQRLGIPVPEPVGALEETWWGMPVRSLYAARWVSGATSLRQVLRDIRPDRGDAGDRLRQLAFASGRFLGELHRMGVACLDLNSGNLLVSSGPRETPRFLLVDYERIAFDAAVVARKRLDALSQLGAALLPALEDAPRHLCRGYVAGYGEMDPAAMEAAVERLCRQRYDRQVASISARFVPIAEARREERGSGRSGGASHRRSHR